MSQGNEDKLRLMVVDDEPDNLDLLYRTFRRDFEVLKAASGSNALQVLEREGEMAIIISDQRMPGMNGTEFLSKTVERYPDTIRIVLTGYTDVEDLVDAINTGKVFKYITKPWIPDDLRAVVQQAAETYRVLKKRTNELRRALRRESLFNGVMTAIRESLDYRSMLQTIVESIGGMFEASHCILRPIENGSLTKDIFLYRDGSTDPDSTNAEGELSSLALGEGVLIQTVLASHKVELDEGDTDGRPYIRLIVPLTYQHNLLAILALYQSGTAHPWLPEDIQLIEGVAEQAALAISQAKLYQQIQEQTQQMRAELQVARQIQSNLLRQSMPEVEGLTVQASCVPANEVGGDFFEVFVHPQGDIWLTVGDVSGKGVPAALFMASAISILRRELSQEMSPEPDVVMHNLNSSLSDDLIGNNRFITMVLARYNPVTRHLAYANAGHIYPMVWSHRLVTTEVADPDRAVTVEPDYLKVRGIPLGIRPVWKAAAGSVILHSGEVFLLTSDGITEATFTEDAAENGQQTSSMLQQTGLWQLLMHEPFPFDLSHLLARVRSHNSVQEDDQTILSLEVL